MSMNTSRNDIAEGLRDGTPIALGYFAVAFSLGIIAKKAGLTAALGFVSSFFTRASAGEYGVYTLVALNATYVEVVVICLVANLRYMLMSAALSQKLAPGTPWYHRVLMACCITDEVFGISIGHRGHTPPAYTYSAALLSTLCWASGCATGIVAGGMLPTHRVAVHRHHHAASAPRPQRALRPCDQLRAERHMRGGSRGEHLEQRHAHHCPDHCHLGRCGLAETYQTH